VPVGISGFIATGGDIRGSLLQAVNLVIAALLYYPFFKAWERILVTREEEAARQEENKAALQVEVRQRIAAKGGTHS
jgi:PTS system cellobiose-specific IIC component